MTDNSHKLFLILIGHLLILPLFIIGQDSIRGRVFDHSSLEPLINVSIYAPETLQGTITDEEGYFMLPRSQELIFSSVGYFDQHFLVTNDQEFIRIFMEASSYNLQEVIVTAIPSDRERLISSSAAINMINLHDLDWDNKTQVAQILNRTPGMYMHSGTLNTNRLTIRGIGSRTPYTTNKIRAYFRDIPLTSGSGETTLEDIDLDLIGRIEVIKGPSSSLYGAGLGGVVLMYPISNQKPGFRLVQKNLFGSYGLFRNTTGIEHTSPKTTLGITYNKTNSDGYRENNEYSRNGLFLNAAFYPSEKHNFTLLSYYTNVEAFIPSSLNRMDYEHNPRSAADAWAATRGVEDYDKWIIGFTHTYYVNASLSLKTAFFGGSRKNFEIRPFNILEEQSWNIGIRSYLRYHKKVGKVKTTILFGGELYNEDYSWRTFENVDREKGSLLSDNEERQSYVNLFFQSSLIPIDRLRIHLGVNMNKTNYDYMDLFLSNGDKSGKYGFDLMVSPRIAASFMVWSNIFIYGNISHGFSPPSLVETLTPDGAVNKDIQPETGWNFEIGTRGSLLRNRLSFDLSLYAMPVENLLVARRTAEDQFIGVNAGKTNHNGIEMGIQIFLIQKSSVALQLFMNGTFSNYRFKEFLDDEEDYSGNRLTGTPKNTFNSGIEFNGELGFYGILNFQFIDEMPLRDDNSIFSESYELVNLKAGFQKLFFSHLEFDAYLGINNLLNEKYASMLLINAPSFGGEEPRYYYPGLPLNYFGGISLAYKF